MSIEFADIYSSLLELLGVSLAWPPSATSLYGRSSTSILGMVVRHGLSLLFRTLSPAVSVASIRNLYKGIKGKFAVEEIWIGGRGNPDIQCLAICQDQLELMENSDDEAINFSWTEEQLRE